jgi:anti-anti-sigma factor
MNDLTFAHLKRRLEQGVVILTVTVPHIRSGAFALVDALRQEFTAALEGLEQPHVIVDLSQIEYFGSAGVRPLLGLRRQIQDAGGRLILCSLSADVEEVLRTTRLISPDETTPAAFDVEPDVKTALARLVA